MRPMTVPSASTTISSSRSRPGTDCRRSTFFATSSRPVVSCPEGLPSVLQPSDLHDALWSLLAAVYAGAVHPTAEGHAAMADAAVPVARQALGLPVPDTLVRSEPLPLPVLLPPRLPSSGR
jgi:hypothetical protein